MSAIAGCIHFDGRPADRARVEAMMAAMPARGADGAAHWVCGAVALGYRASCVPPDSRAERQPLRNEDDSLALVLDGWLSNADALRATLEARGALLRDCRDGELVLRAYETWGEDCLAQMQGDFAFAIWDGRRHVVFCGRDHVGNRPFFYRWDGATFVFASELAPLLIGPGPAPKLNEAIVAEYLACEWLSKTETLWEGALRLAPAHRMRVDARGPHPENYWRHDLSARIHYGRLEDYADHYRALLESVVARMSRTPGPLACEVSGGLDSSALFAVADSLLARGRLAAPDLHGYTLKFDGDTPANELHYARAVARHVGRAVAEIEPARPGLAWSREAAQRTRNFPAYPNGVMGLSIRQAARARGSRVLLVGEGGDQWLGGSRLYYADALGAGAWGEFGQRFAEDRARFGLARALWFSGRYGLYPLLPDPLRALARRALRTHIVEGTDPRAWLSPRLAALHAERRRTLTRAPPAGASASQISHLMTLDSAYSLIAREQEERMAASVGIELRRPFFSTEIIEFCLATPEWLRLAGDVDRRLHRIALAGLLPDDVLQRRTKADFMEMFLGQCGDLQAFFAEPQRALGDWVEPARLKAALARAAAGPSIELWMVWGLFGCAAVEDR